VNSSKPPFRRPILFYRLDYFTLCWNALLVYLGMKYSKCIHMDIRVFIYFSRVHVSLCTWVWKHSQHSSRQLCEELYIFCCFWTANPNKEKFNPTHAESYSLLLDAKIFSINSNNWSGILLPKIGVVILAYWHGAVHVWWSSGRSVWAPDLYTYVISMCESHFSKR